MHNATLRLITVWSVKAAGNISKIKGSKCEEINQNVNM